MKISKKEEAEALQVYMAFMECYLNGDVKNYPTFFDADFHFVGTVTEEEFLTKEEATTFYEATAEQFAGKLELRNRNITTEPIGELILIGERCDGYFLAEGDWTFYSRFRMSTLLQQKNGQWKFIHQHISMPDLRAEQGETIAIDQIKTENIQLREAVKRRTIELENKTRDLEIETSLEKVRTVAMAMRQPNDMLEVCRMISDQLEILGIKEIRNVQTAIIDEDGNGNYLNYQYFNQYGEGTIELVDSSKHPQVKAMIQRMQQSRDAFFSHSFEGVEFDQWKQYRKDDNQFPDPILEEATALHFYYYSIGQGGLGISVYTPLTDDDIAIFNRFRKVFDLAYQRFRDIEQAEAQAREARIEASLERVRAVAMIMRKSEELSTVSEVIFTELTSLGFADLRNTEIIINQDKKESILSYYYSDYGITGVIEVFYQENPTVRGWMEDMKKASDAFAKIEISENEMEAWRRYREQIGYLPDPKLKDANRVFYYSYSIGLGALSISFFEPITDEEMLTLERFRNVFGIAYRRYVDVAQAEVQVREAKIEAALERMRSKAMAMHQSEDMLSTTMALFTILREIGIHSVRAGIGIVTNPEIMEWEAWGITVDQDEHTIPTRATFTSDVHLVSKGIFDHWQQQDSFWEFDLSGAELKSFVKDMPRNYLPMHEATGNLPSEIERVVFHYCSFPQGIVFSGTTLPFKEEEIVILKKFTRVFAGVFTRFLDLQKAESQAREAQIEASLERVRSRTMGMQHSHELGDVATVLFKELNQLVENLWTCGFVLCEKDRGEDEWWLSTGDGFIPAFYLPNTVDPTHANIYAAWKKGETYHTEQLEGEALQEHYDWLMNIPVSKNIFDEMKAAGHSLPSWQKLHCAYFSYGYLVMITQVPCPEEQLFKRFALVFDQTYTRFLDLQKAEAQAREAQIELGLERVRARAMAMQRSTELSDLVTTVFKELTKLDFALNWCIINIIDESSLSNMVWAANPDMDKAPASYHMKFENYPFHDAMMKGYKERASQYIYVLEGLEKKIYDEYLFKETEFRKVPAAAQAASRAMERYVVSFSFSNFGGLQTVGNEPLSDSNLDILERFGKVFDLTYTRFNDLQKAEAQAREAQIEASLERVRSRAMAIRKSDELGEVIQIIFREMNKLGINLMECSIATYDDINPKDLIYWSAGPFGSAQSSSTKLQYIDHPLLIELLNDFKIGTQYRSGKYSGKLLQTWWDRIFVETDFKYAPKDFIESWKKIKQIYYSQAAMNHGFLEFLGEAPLPDDKVQILKRFTNVIDLTYTRYDDVVKAEAQAREAQIQLAMERVRARTMAMQNSDELPEAANLLFQQVQSLGMPAWSAGYCIWQEDKNAIMAWMSSEGVIQPPFRVPLTEEATFIHMREGWERGESFYVDEISDEVCKKHYAYMRTLPSVGKILDSIIEAGHPLPTFQIMHMAYFSQGFLLFITYEPVPQAHDIFKRFGKVFDQTYTRFLDLQKAEAQAREAKIETALERVRSRTMGMQKSEELKEVIQVVFEQFIHLKINIEHTGFVMDYKVRDDYDIWVADPLGVPSQVTIPYFDCIYYNQFNDAKEQGIDFFATYLTFEEKNTFYQKLFEYVPGLPEEAKKFYFSCPGLAASTVLLDNIGLYIENFSGTPYTDEENATLMRFGKVFQQTYTRFLDLQKAEAQGREAKIETALEKVRSRTMAMQRSDELQDAAIVLFQQIKSLDVETGSCGFNIWDKDKYSATVWMSSPEGGLQEPFKLMHTESEIYKEVMEAWRSRKNILVKEVSGEALKKHFDYLLTLPGIGSVIKELRNKNYSFPERMIYHFVFFHQGYLSFHLHESRTETHDIFKRFANVFEQTYTRFLDLQKAEEQAREAQIELALERVRARTMAMQKPDELADAAQLLYREFGTLGINTFSCGYMFIDEAKNTQTAWVVLPDGTLLRDFIVFPLTGDHVLDNRYNDWKEKKPLHIYEIQGEVNKEHHRFLSNYVPPFVVKDVFSRVPDRIVFHCANFSNGYLLILATDFFSPEETQTIIRFAKVFEMTYTRFLDLKKAEAQAREARIEAALEKVRGRTMAMQKSNELPEAANLLFQQVQALGMPAWSAGYTIWDEDKKAITLWMSSEGVLQPPFRAPLTEDPSFIHFLEAHQRGETLHVEEVGGDALSQHYKYMRTLPDVGEILEKIIEAGFPLPTFQIFHAAYFSQGFLLFITYEPVPDAYEIFKRFANVFDQTYTRFLDLQKSEAQTRESQIETALERVRSRTLAMHSSDELAETAAVLFRQLIALGIAPTRLYIGIIKDDNGDIELWATDEDGSKVNTQFTGNIYKSVIISKMYVGWKEQKKSLIIDIQGKEMSDYFQYLSVELKIPFRLGLDQKRRVQNIAYFSKGFIGISSPDDQPEETTRLLERFAAVFNLTYTRFNDLQHAEAQTHKAKIEVALERVRARALAMQEPEELVEVAQVMRHEMGLLGVEELETSSIYIHDDGSDIANCWYAITDIREPEKNLVADHITMELHKTWVGKEMLDFYNSNQQQTSIIMQGANRIEWIKYCASISDVLGDFYGEVIPDRTYHLYKFSNGAIGAAAEGDISEESWELLRRATSVFSLAYSRFKDLTQSRLDLQRLKAEKQRAEDALTELKATQSQLVQSEKMASLGELTAGIAHEIQNPLNFVNNFSEVNTELIEEMKQELQNGNTEEAIAIAKDIADNEQKINHHGKRADAIVKGMLQHSRTSSGVKEPTDINALADEYLRLAYHGLRAKDKSFNATMKTDFDDSIGMINVIPQDIGRVILNLITNAFYAVSTAAPKSPKGDFPYEPTVTISTRKISHTHPHSNTLRIGDLGAKRSIGDLGTGSVEISVRDNGPGIPQHILDKIFQPFFTTKPTGQGTGLGLSLSFDIIMAHGGELKVQTKEGEGSEFSIILPQAFPSDKP